ncbi:MAG TPA: hypothetical protein VK207_04120 [Bacteroidales bacterium]|nr:hypothetical protein [Bacteroidales bacterium]
MEGFTYTNIFDTKGIEYLIIIGFLVLIIPFWYFLNRKKPVYVPARNAFSQLIREAPMGIFFSRNHTWAYLEPEGLARMGVDDFIFRVTGKMKLKMLRNEGEIVKKGDLMAEATRDGKKLRIYSPVSGKISEMNVSMDQKIFEADPYGDGWICKMVPSDWKAETQSFMLAGEARAWLNKELERFRDMVAGVVSEAHGAHALVLQDGGEIAGHPLAELNDEAWAVFEKSFLTLEAGND